MLIALATTNLLKWAVLIGTVCIYGLAACSIPQAKSNSQYDSPSFPFKVVDESAVGNGTIIRKARILLSPNDFSENNLSNLFRWYSKLHPNDKEALIVLVYTNVLNLQTDKENELKGIGFGSINRLAPYQGQYVDSQVLYDAFFRRTVTGAGLGSGRNELYTYRPDLSKPEETKNVILKGVDEFATK